LSTNVKASRRKDDDQPYNLTAMIKPTRAQLPKYVNGVIVVVNMNLLSTHAIGREACLHVKGLYGLFKDLRPKWHPNI
jgi:hypothetical protein